MSENNKIRLYSYSKVWRVKKKIYAIQNIILPAPIEPYDLLYFAAAAAVIMILGNLIPILRGIPTIIRFVVIPYGVTQFLTKKKLDGKNPIKYFIGYIYYVFAIRNTYIEKFKMYPDRKEERLKIKWFCSKGYSKRPLWDYNRFFGGNKKRRDKKKASQRTSVSKRDTSPKKNKKISEKRTQENAKKIRISSGPKLKANTKSEKDHSAEMVHKSLILEKKLKRLCKEVSEIINDPKTRETAIKIIKILFHFFSFLFKGLQKIISSLQARRSDKSSGPKAVDTTLEKRKKEKEPKPKADKKVAILENITLVISVCSLVPGVGSTHTAKALAYFIKHLIKKSVCIIDEKGNSKVNDINGIEVYKRDNLYELYDRYHYIILDVGKYDSTAQKEVKRSQIKIMCAVMDDKYLQQLAEFIEREKAEKWKFIFNHVPENRRKLVDDKMEDYEHWCMPVNDGMTFDKSTVAVFTKLVKGEKI